MEVFNTVDEEEDINKVSSIYPNQDRIALLLSGFTNVLRQVVCHKDVSK